MNPGTAAACLLLALPSALNSASTDAPDELVSKAAVDDVRTRRFSISTEMALDEMIMELDGQEMDTSMMGDMEMCDSSSFQLEVTDTVLAAEGGRATRFNRRYDSAARTSKHDADMPMGEPQNGTLNGTTSLAGRDVEFALEDDEFSARFADGEEDGDGVLDGLNAALDLSELLPAGDVSIGDTWEIDPDVSALLLNPGGALPMDDEAEGNTELLTRRDRTDAALRDYEGTFTAEYKGSIEQDGKQLASIELKCELECAVDVTAIMEENAPEVHGPDGMEIELEFLSADLEQALEGGGTLLWDVAGSALSSLELELEVTRIHTTEMEITFGERVMAQVQTQINSGTTSLAVEFE